MIAPRATRLVRVPGLRTMHDAVARLAARPSLAEARRVAVVVPTASAAERLRRTLERLWLVDERWPPAPVLEALPGPPPHRAPAFVPPAIVTRAGLYERLQAALPAAPRALSLFERETLLGAAAAAATTAGHAPPFPVRPGLVAEMLRFYDDLRRQHRDVDDVERVLLARLEPGAEFDRGAARLLQQTRFLVAAFRGYEARRDASSATDEHVVRRRWLEMPAERGPFEHAIVTVADQAAEPGGLWATDFDLLTRLGGLERLDVVATEATLATGLHERLFDVLHGIEEVPVGVDEPAPVLVAPPEATGRFYFLARDREEEVASIVRQVKAGGGRPAAAAPSGASLDEVALVYQRPLSYLYIARHAFDSARVPCEATGALPLAAEPFVAAFDLVASAVQSSFTRATLVPLLASPHLTFRSGTTDIDAADALALDHALAAAGFLGGVDALRHLAERWRTAAPPSPRWQRRGRLVPAIDAALSVAEDLAPLAGAAPVSSQVDGLLAFLDAHERPPGGDDPAADRTARARAALRAALVMLGDAARTHGDQVLRFDEVVSMVRRFVEGHTFTPRLGASGVQLIDAEAARYGRFRIVHLVGLVESDWQAPAGRHVFYPAFLLRDLGWPADAARHAAARAAFHDLLGLATDETRVSAFQLEDEAIVRPSPLVEDLDAAGLAVVRIEAPADALVFADEGLWCEPPEAPHGDVEAAAWLALRAARSDAGLPAFHGHAGAAPPGRVRVTAVETYLQCPFKYYASHVLRLDEPPDEDPLLSPRERGTFVHRVFEDFFDRWQQNRGGAISPATLDEARHLFGEVTDAALEHLPGADRDIERRRLLGSAVASGLGDRVLAFEASQEVGIVDRRLEVAFDGEFRVGDGEAARTLRLGGKADRIDLLADGTLRLVDYKTGRAPRKSEAIQLAVYGYCAEQALDGALGRHWRVGQAGYLAFGETDAWTPVVRTSADRDAVLAEGAVRFVAAFDGIARGEFPPRPAEARLCTTCAFAAVCRKDIVDDGE